MKQLLYSSARLTATFRLFFICVAVFTLFRLIFYLCFYHNAESFSLQEAMHAFIIGLRFDSRVATVLVLPVLLLSLFAKLSWSKSVKAMNIWLWAYTTILAFIALIYGADIGYYAYLESRINFRIFEFLHNPLISFKMVYETYNIWLWGTLFLVFTYAIYYFLKIFIFKNHFKSAYNQPKNKLPKVTQSLLLSGLVVLGIHNSFGQYPLRWSDSFFSQNMFISSLGMSPVHYIFETAENSRRDYDTDKAREFYHVIAPYLGVKELNLEKLNFRRPVAMTPRFTTKPNIVYIVMESMASYKTGVFGNLPDSSASLDNLAKSGWLFRHFYTPTEGTARSLFCILSGVPDINAKSTSSRNPLIVDQHTLINGFHGYDKFYFIGGSATWGNIRGVYMNNVENLKMYEDADLDGPNTDVWGLSDLDLFRATAKTLSKRDNKPFFALIQTASYHRPYTIPKDHGTFALKTLTPDELHKFGFNSNEEYNSFRFADYSLGEFFNLIKNEEFFKNTIFVIHGDHGLPHMGATNISDGYKFFGLNRFHTPLVIYSPLIKKPEEFSMMVGEHDVMSILLGITGNEYVNQTLGRNVFALDPKEPSYAFSYVYYSDPLQIMLYDQNFLVYGTEKKIESLHLYQSADPKTDVKDKYPDKFNKMRELLQGIFETSKYVLHHNKKVR
ncbi:MAG: hypothetical protein A2Z20_08910 [Bdellovibrionales bacterium RBG_16_40_8]|nr:MAG: hypothetical protein A2Z20_08910 [Bdellovibrionales bacterium RBG_16_40_8]